MEYGIKAATVAVFLGLIMGFGLAFWAVPDRTFSEEENRVLQALPVSSDKGWTDGTLSANWTDYYADQFPLRTLWLGIHGLCEWGMGRGESNGVLMGADGLLAVRRHDMYVGRTERAEDTDFFRLDHVDAGLDALCRLDASLAADGIPLTVLLPPRTVDVTADDFLYPSLLSDALDERIRTRLIDVDHVSLLAEFRARHRAGEAVYFRTDHHWTQRGAYLAYEAVMTAFGMEEDILPLSFYDIRTIPDFYGTTHARAGLFFLPPDTMEIFCAADGSDAFFVVQNARGEAVIDAGFISEKHLSEKDKYGAFLDGTHALLTVTDTRAEAGARPRLLVARDSFGASMIPFLARHFDIVTVNLTANLSGGMTDLSALAATYACDRVLVVCNRENLLTSDCLRRVT